jgi:hypothetical protein
MSPHKKDWIINANMRSIRYDPAISDSPMVCTHPVRGMHCKPKEISTTCITFWHRLMVYLVLQLLKTAREQQSKKKERLASCYQQVTRFYITRWSWDYLVRWCSTNSIGLGKLLMYNISYFGGMKVKLISADLSFALPFHYLLHLLCSSRADDFSCRLFFFYMIIIIFKL